MRLLHDFLESGPVICKKKKKMYVCMYTPKTHFSFLLFEFQNKTIEYIRASAGGGRGGPRDVSVITYST